MKNEKWRSRLCGKLKLARSATAIIHYSLFSLHFSLRPRGRPAPAWAEFMRRQMRSKPEIAEALDERAMPRVSEETASEGYIRGEEEEKSTRREDAAAGKSLTSEQTNDTLRPPIEYNEGDILPELPEYKKAYCAPEKIYGYSLNMGHPDGRNKAIVFQSVLGFNTDNGEQLMQAILKGLRSAHAKVGPLTVHGQKYVVDMPITGPNGNTAIVRTAWIVRPGKNNPDLVSAYIKK